MVGRGDHPTQENRLPLPPGPLTKRREVKNKKPGFGTQTALYWLKEKGVYCVPLRPREKRPKTSNWPKLRLVEDTIPEAFKDGDNIGALWGEPSNNATDLDLDLPEACLVAPHILPDTFIYGRGGKRWSHYVFRCPGAQTRKWQIKTLGTIVEIRSTGAQSVLPPSIHPDGDRYFIEEDVEFHPVSQRELEQYADMIAIAAVFLHFYPESGSRHDYVHAITGTLCHAEWSDKKVKIVIGAVLSCVQEEEDEMADRKGAVLNTIEHYKIGDRIQGFRTLETWMDTMCITQLRRWTRSGTKEGRILTPVELVPPPSQGESDFNEEWLQVPGLVGSIAEWAGKAAYIQQPVFNLATAIMCTALASSNNYIVDGWDTPLQPYLMVTGNTGSGKGAVLSAITRFAKEIDMEDAVRRGFQSYYAMLDELAEPPYIKLWLWDEAARALASAKSSASVDFQMLTHVISLYGRANEWVPGTPGRKTDIPALNRPFLCVLATAQPDLLVEVLGVVSETTGFINRFPLFDCGDLFPERNRRRTTTFPSAIKRAARVLMLHEPTSGNVTRIGWDTQKAYALFDDFDEVARRRTFRREYVWGRATQNALILAGLAAVGVDANKPMITEELARWSMEIINWSNIKWADKIRLQGGETVNEKAVNKIQRIIKDPKKSRGSAQSLIHQDLINKGFMPHSLLIKVTTSIPTALRETILDDLHDADVIGSAEMGDNTVYFMK